MSEGLPFTIKVASINDSETVSFYAHVDGREITSERYRIDNGKERQRVAKLWSKDERLRNSQLLEWKTVARALEQKEREIRNEIDKQANNETEQQVSVEAASYVDDDKIVELAWNYQSKNTDFIIYDRHTQSVSRASQVETTIGVLTPPTISKGIVTPGGNIPGIVFVPSDFDESGIDEESLRTAIRSFINSYVQLPDGAIDICVEYILMTWIYHAFDEIPYLAFRTSAFGRGKTRGNETVGCLCYRPMICGGGSSAAATLRLLDIYGGTLLADEFDQNQKTELACEIIRITNQGFQRNRPLVKCQGEANTPTPFQCYGPKIYALRKKMGDDASESRIISIRMIRRTRKGIPKNLPRQEFDSRALRIRNRLLAWRCCNLGKIQIVPELADERLEDRFNQIAAPLLAVAQTDSARQQIVESLIRQQGDVAADHADAETGEAFEAILAIGQPGDLIRPADVAIEINRKRAEVQKIEIDKLRDVITPQKVGGILSSELELPRVTRDRRGVRYSLESARMNDLSHRFGIPLAQPTQPTQPTHLHTTPEPTPETPLFDSAKAESVDGVDGVGSTEDPCRCVDSDVDDSDLAERQAIQSVEAEREAAR